MIKSPWAQDLQTASFAGIPFGVERTEATLGRRIVPHLYPNRDKPYFEDLGAAPKYYSFDAWLNGDDVHAQRRQFEAALDNRGNQTLVHPSRGAMQAMLQSASFLEAKDDGRVIRCRLTFAVADDRASPLLYPYSVANTGSQTDAATAGLGGASAADFSARVAPGGFLDDVGDALTQVGDALGDALDAVGGAVNDALDAVDSVLSPIEDAVGDALDEVGTALAPIGAALSTAGQFLGQLGSVAGQVLGIVGSVRGLDSLFADAGVTFGRYGSGQIARVPQAASTIDQTQPLARRLDAATNALLAGQAATASRLPNCIGIALQFHPHSAAFPLAIQALVEAARLNCNDPADAISLLAGLATFPAPAAPPGSSPINAATQAATAATAALCRQAALLSLARATRAYQPTSSTDTATLAATLAPLYDAEIEYAADTAALATYRQLRAVRAAILADLASRGSQLPPLATFDLPGTLPSLTLAYRLYADAARADDLIARADPINPAFMPRHFTALSA